MPVAFLESGHRKASLFQPESESLVCMGSPPHKVTALAHSSVPCSSHPKLLLSSFWYWQIQHKSWVWHLSLAFLSKNNIAFICFVIAYSVVTKDSKRNKQSSTIWTDDSEQQSLVSFPWAHLPAECRMHSPLQWVIFQAIFLTQHTFWITASCSVLIKNDFHWYNVSKYHLVG